MDEEQRKHARVKTTQTIIITALATLIIAAAPAVPQYMEAKAELMKQTKETKQEAATGYATFVKAFDALERQQEAERVFNDQLAQHIAVIERYMTGHVRDELKALSPPRRRTLKRESLDTDGDGVTEEPDLSPRARAHLSAPSWPAPPKMSRESDSLVLPRSLDEAVRAARR